MSQKSRAIDPAEAVAFLRKLVGHVPWGIRRGVDVSITLEFGQVASTHRTNDGRLVEHGEMHLWLHSCAWRVIDDCRLLIGSADDADDIKAHLSLLEQREVVGVHLTPTLDLTLEFGAGLALQTFSNNAVELEHWFLYLKDGSLVTAGPGFVLKVV